MHNLKVCYSSVCPSKMVTNAVSRLSLVSEPVTSVAQGKGMFERRNHVQLWKNVHPSVAESSALEIPQQTILIILHHIY